MHMYCAYMCMRCLCMISVCDLSEVVCACARLQRLGLTKALVVHSAGLDELTPMAPADVVEVEAGKQGFRRYQIDPKDLGIPRCTVSPCAHAQ